MINKMFENSLFPESKWKKKEDSYIRSHFVPRNSVVEIESIMVNKDSAMVVFNHGVRRFQLDALEFRELFVSC